ncbi:MAG: hypothetical protein ACPL1Y_00215 [Thermoplasmata archaeon]
MAVRKGRKKLEPKKRVPDLKEVLVCYVFNDAMDPLLDDGACEHCKYFLTMKCPHIDEFIEEVEDMEPEL